MVSLRRWHVGLFGGALLASGLGVTFVAESANTSPARATASVVDGKLRVSGTTGDVDLQTAQPVGAVALASDGGELALTTGTPIEEAIGGVRGQVAVVDSADGSVLAQTEFDRAVVTGVDFSRDGRRVAFVKDYQELWVMEADGSELRKVADAGALAPVLGSTLFDPAFSPSGQAVYFGLVEQTFFGEDDKVDNIWKVSMDGEASRVTHLSAPGGLQSWTVVRGPLPVGHGEVLFTTGRSTESLWQVARVGSGGRTTALGPVPSMTKAIGVSSREITFETLDNRTAAYDLYSMSFDDGRLGWDRWCAAGCRTIDRGVDAGAVSFPVAGGDGSL
ncbi:hypothetical protein BH20ACT22_BH20ACT22_02870 [soil metagenome]